MSSLCERLSCIALIVIMVVSPLSFEVYQFIKHGFCFANPDYGQKANEQEELHNKAIFSGSIITGSLLLTNHPNNLNLETNNHTAISNSTSNFNSIGVTYNYDNAYPVNNANRKYIPKYQVDRMVTFGMSACVFILGCSLAFKSTRKYLKRNSLAGVGPKAAALKAWRKLGENPDEYSNHPYLPLEDV